MPKATKQIGRKARAWTAALAVGRCSRLASSPRPRRPFRRPSGASSRRRRPTEEQFQRLKRGGVDSVRIPIDWGAVQPTRGGAFDWAGIDALVAKARRRPGIEVLPFLNGAPSLGGAVGLGSRAPTTPSRRPATCRPPAPPRPPGRASSTSAVARYGPNGTFWAANPRSPSARSATGRSGTRRTSSTSSPSPTRPNTGSWSRSPTRR